MFVANPVWPILGYQLSELLCKTYSADYPGFTICTMNLQHVYHCHLSTWHQAHLADNGQNYC